LPSIFIDSTPDDYFRYFEICDSFIPIEFLIEWNEVFFIDLFIGATESLSEYYEFKVSKFLVGFGLTMPAVLTDVTKYSSID